MINLTQEQYDNNVKLIEALHSGKYKQGTGRLRRDDTFCCLGVACDLIDPSGWNGNSYIEQNESISAYLAPNSIINKYGFNCGRGFDLNNHTLSSLNDNGKSFKEIADMLEQFLKKEVQIV